MHARIDIDQQIDRIRNSRQIDVSELRVRRPAAKFAKSANLDPAGGLRFTRSADQWPSRPQRKRSARALTEASRPRFNPAK